MRKRNVAILFRLNKKEAEALDKKVKKSGLNREAYLRQLISGVVPKDAPPPDYYSMMRELHKIGNNLNQIAQKAHLPYHRTIRYRHLSQRVRITGIVAMSCQNR